MAENRMKNKRWSLEGTTALVTGGTKGIGHAIVEELASFGATVHTCSRNESELKRCLQEWQNSGISVTGSVCDLTSYDDRKKLMEEVSSIFHGKLNILINNVGAILVKPAVEVTMEDYSRMMSTNFELGFHLSQLAYPLLKASEGGSIVQLSSLASVQATYLSSVYGASKSAMNQLTRSLACEWAKDNIRINGIAPGLTRTPLVEPVGCSYSMFFQRNRRRNCICSCTLISKGMYLDVKNFLKLIKVYAHTLCKTGLWKCYCFDFANTSSFPTWVKSEEFLDTTKRKAKGTLEE